MSVTRGSSGCRRLNASNWPVSLAPSRTLDIASAIRARAPSLPSRSRPSSWRVPETICSRLLKSWATPPVSRPIASIFWASRSAASALMRSAVASETRWPRVSFSAVSAASLRRTSVTSMLTPIMPRKAWSAPNRGCAVVLRVRYSPSLRR